MSGAVIWFTGLSGSGKSTLAERLQELLRVRGVRVRIIDGDQLRDGRERPLGFTRPEILVNGFTAIELARDAGERDDYVLVSLITPLEEVRREARTRLAPRCFEVYVATSVATCRTRDTKGLYRRAEMGELENLIGVSPDTPFELPGSPDFVAQTEGATVEDLAVRLLADIDRWRSDERAPSGPPVC